MVAQDDVIRVLFLLNLQNRKCKQVILAPTCPISPRTLLSKQLYYGSTRCDVPSATFPCVQQQQLVTPAPTGPTDPCALLSKQLYYSSRSIDLPPVPSPFFVGSWRQTSYTSSCCCYSCCYMYLLLLFHACRNNNEWCQLQLIIAFIASNSMATLQVKWWSFFCSFMTMIVNAASRQRLMYCNPSIMFSTSINICVYVCRLFSALEDELSMA